MRILFIELLEKFQTNNVRILTSPPMLLFHFSKHLVSYQSKQLNFCCQYRKDCKLHLRDTVTQPPPRDYPLLMTELLLVYLGSDCHYMHIFSVHAYIKNNCLILKLKLLHSNNFGFSKK